MFTNWIFDGFPVMLGYIDPGAGSMLLQLALAGVLTGLHVAGLRLAKIKLYLRSLRKSHA